MQPNTRAVVMMRARELSCRRGYSGAAALVWERPRPRGAPPHPPLNQRYPPAPSPSFNERASVRVSTAPSRTLLPLPRFAARFAADFPPRAGLPAPQPRHMGRLARRGRPAEGGSDGERACDADFGRSWGCGASLRAPARPPRACARASERLERAVTASSLQFRRRGTPPRTLAFSISTLEISSSS